MNKLNVCPGTLRPGFETYSPRSIREMFNGSVIDHVLDIDLPADGWETLTLKLHRRKMSVAEDGQYILKTAPHDMENADQFVGNSHLTMQIATEVFQIPTEKTALIFTKDGTPLYLSKRSEVNKNGSISRIDDFMSLAKLTDTGTGSQPMYQLSYYDMSNLIDRYFPAAIPAKEQLFRTVVFNYLFSNGNAHLGNFARIDYDGNGDGKLAPAFNLLNTALHGDTGDLALLGGLYEKDFEKLSYKTLGYYGYDDFFQFGMKMGLVSFRVKRFMDQLLGSAEEVKAFIERAFLSPEAKADYLRLYLDRHEKLSNSYSGLNSVKSGI